MSKPKTIQEFIKLQPPAVQKELKALFAILKKAAPKATGKLAWGMPTLYQEGNLIHFCSFKKHMSIFPGAEAMEFFAPQMKGFVTSKGTMQIPYGAKIPAGLIARMVKFNLKDNLARAKTKVPKKKR
jgi:uncharacterized protein YdhG (YjbR/CyaY superfamily)